MNDDLVHKRYRGEGAKGYDAARSTSARFAAETEAFSRMLGQLEVRSVLDCPFGTGRWIPSYQGIERIFGLDASADMLHEAERKIPSAERSRFKLIRADIFEYDFSLHQDDKIDLVVCVRFLNWISLPRAAQALARLSEIGSGHMIVGASVIPSGAGSLYPIRAWARRQIARLKKDALSQVHPEHDLTDHLASLGWRVQQRIPIFHKQDRANFFYLLHR